MSARRAATIRCPRDKINELIVEKANSGKTVCRLKGGDPYVFGRGGEEGEELVEAGIDFEVVPGITAGVAAPAYAGIPVTHTATTPRPSVSLQVTKTRPRANQATIGKCTASPLPLSYFTWAWATCP